MFGADELVVEFRDGDVGAGSAPRMVIPGKTLAPVPGVVIELVAGAVELEPDVALFEFANPATLLFAAVVFDPVPLPPGSVPGNVRFGCGEIANCPRASPAGTVTG